MISEGANNSVATRLRNAVIHPRTVSADAATWVKSVMQAFSYINKHLQDCTPTGTALRLLKSKMQVILQQWITNRNARRTLPPNYASAMFAIYDEQFFLTIKIIERIIVASQ